MKISIICTGNELLKGSTVNTNMAIIGQAVTALGFRIEQSMVVADDSRLMRGALTKLAPESDIIITSGGLGPTCDDLTRQVVCDFLGLELEENCQLRRELAARWQRRHPDRVPPAEYYRQALAPRNAIILANRVGSAPGLLLEGKGLRIAMLPGPPAELQPMLTEELIPQLRRLIKEQLTTRGLLLAGIPEMSAEERLRPFLKNSGVELALCASLYGVKLFFSGSETAVDSMLEKVKDLFGDRVLRNNSLDLVAELSERLASCGAKLATAESCTGGMIAAEITKLPGASKVFNGAIIAYQNELKTALLGVAPDLLDSAGAVSEQCVRQMVIGVCRRCHADAGIAVSGIAGPDGGSREKPVGLVYIAVKFHDLLEVKRFNFSGNRQTIRERTTAKALLLLRELLLTASNTTHSPED